ncbi:hypothetical protein JCM10212_000844 [Sporobolomyces blumeae]
MLAPRGGVAGGDASRNPTDTTYAAVPPSSTYKGPKVAGTYGGFVGVFVGVGVFVLVVLTILVFLRFRTLKRRDRQLDAIERGTVAGAGARTGRATDAQGRPRGRGNEWDPDEAFEMPTHAAYERAGMDSTLSLNDANDGGFTPPMPPARQLYAADGISQDAFFDGDNRTYDPYDAGKKSAEGATQQEDVDDNEHKHVARERD